MFFLTPPSRGFPSRSFQPRPKPKGGGNTGASTQHWLRTPKASENTDSLMIVYHTTTEASAAEIVLSGFRDKTDTFGTELEWIGVFVSDKH